MKYFLSIILILFLSANIFAEENFEKQNSQEKFGIGVVMNYDQSYTPSYHLLNSQYQVLLTKNSRNIRFELRASILRRSRSDSDSTLLGDISLGLYTSNSLKNNFDIYYGGKLGFISGKSSSSSLDLVSTHITPIIGAEYFFNSNFSVSGEIGLKINILDHDSSDSSEYYIVTTSSILIKWYF
jgi:hypothetical protein